LTPLAGILSGSALVFGAAGDLDADFRNLIEALQAGLLD